jgi:hypothetical protein
MKKLSAALLLASVSTLASAGTITNGDFDAGLAGWSVAGNANAATNVAQLTAFGQISQGFSWSAGETLSFDWNFQANDYLPYNDYSLFQVVDASNNLLANITLSNIAAVGNYGSSGWNTYSYTFANAGSGAFSFGVWNALDDGLSSQLYIDNVRSSDVPEPAGLALLGLGLLGLGMSRKRAAK